MGKNVIVLKSLSIDTSALVAGMEATAKKIKELKTREQELIDMGWEATKSFVANSAALKEL